MSFERLRSDLDPLRHDHPPRAWWDVLLWVPVGYAVTRMLGDTLPPVVMILPAVLAAALHHFAPSFVEVVAGAVGLFASAVSAWDRAGCQTSIGDIGVVVVVVFGSIFVVSSFVRLIGAASVREMAKHLLIATATVEISLFAVNPGGDPVVDPREVFAPALLAVVLMAVSQIGLIDRMQLGMLALGAMLLPVETVLALEDNPCGAGGFGPLVGTVAFAVAAYSFASARPAPGAAEEPEPAVDPITAHGDDGRVGVWVDATPESGVWVDTSGEGAWVDGTPETGSWLDDDYEDEFRDPDAGRPPDDDSHEGEPRSTGDPDETV